MWFLKRCLNRCCTKPLDFKISLQNSVFVSVDAHNQGHVYPPRTSLTPSLFSSGFSPFPTKGAVRGCAFFQPSRTAALHRALPWDEKERGAISRQPRAWDEICFVLICSTQMVTLIFFWPRWRLTGLCRVCYVIGEREGSNRGQNILKCNHINGEQVVLSIANPCFPCLDTVHIAVPTPLVLRKKPSAPSCSLLSWLGFNDIVPGVNF